MKSFILIAMLFCHALDDFVLQGIIESMKQKKWWEENAPAQKYKHDYIMALIAHSLIWTFVMMLPVALYYHFNVPNLFFFWYVLHAIVHGVIDDLKANRHQINLVFDQSIHYFQVIAVWLALVVLV